MNNIHQVPNINGYLKFKSINIKLNSLSFTVIYLIRKLTTKIKYLKLRVKEKSKKIVAKRKKILHCLNQNLVKDAKIQF